MADDVSPLDSLVPISGRRLDLPSRPIFHLQRAAAAEHEIGAFRKWAGYKDLGCDAATDGVVLFQHVLSFGSAALTGRTGIHCHLAQVHIVIPTSGRGVFSYDGVVTEAVPGAVINQHGGTVHDQFDYSYAAASAEENRKTPLSVDPTPAGAPPASFGFLEFFVPGHMADVEIVPPSEVTAADQACAWDHPYHAPGAHYALQSADDPDAAWRPLAGQPGLEIRNAGTWEPTGRVVATCILRAAQSPASMAAPAVMPGEDRGLEIYFVVAGAISLERPDGSALALGTGDCLTCTAGLAGALSNPSADLRLLRFFVSERTSLLRQRSQAEIDGLEALGPRIVRRREVRPEGDARPVNVLCGDIA